MHTIFPPRFPVAARESERAPLLDFSSHGVLAGSSRCSYFLQFFPSAIKAPCLWSAKRIFFWPSRWLSREGLLPWQDFESFW